ncbi:MAG: hydroxymethylbilane synthase [Actinomycetota bacterium]|nr:hydroxymethylbilane synthase [Actinomycetota bacterium]
MTKQKLVIGSRGSKLALWQTNHIADELRSHFDIDIEIKTIKTQGDKILDTPLAKIGGKGLFVKEIENALTAGDIDLAVHSMKDVPTELPDGLGIAAMTVRADPRDVLISKNNVSLTDLPQGAVIGTSSLRRQSQLLNLRPDFKMVDVRGNLDTRLRKIEEGRFDAIILAAAGIDRLGYSDMITERIPSELMISAVGQGSIGIEIRGGDARIAEYIKVLNDPDTFAAITAERGLMAQLQGGCQVPIGAIGRIIDGELRLDGIVASLDGREVYKDKLTGDPADAQEIGFRLATLLSDAGADAILADIRATFDVEDGIGV